MHASYYIQNNISCNKFKEDVDLPNFYFMLLYFFAMHVQKSVL